MDRYDQDVAGTGDCGGQVSRLSPASRWTGVGGIVRPASSHRSVVILRLRGRSDLGTTFMDVVRRYAVSLQEVGSRLVIVSTNERIDEQLAVTGVLDVVGTEALYRGDERVGAALQAAEADAAAWIDRQRRAEDEEA